MSSLYNLYITERDRSIKGLNMSALSLLDESINCGISTLDEEFERVCVFMSISWSVRGKVWALPLVQHIYVVLYVHVPLAQECREERCGPSRLPPMDSAGSCIEREGVRVRRVEKWTQDGLVDKYKRSKESWHQRFYERCSCLNDVCFDHFEHSVS